MNKLLRFLPGVLLAVWLLVLPGCAKPPGGEMILYHTQSSENRAQTALWQVDPNDGKPEKLTDFGWSGAYSPDNKSIAFGEFYSSGIWVLKVGSGAPVRLTDFGSSPAWSPDGKMIAFHSGGTAGAERYIWVMNADGSDARQISSVNGSQPDWSPDGKQIVFHGEVNNGIWLINPDGSGETQLLRLGAYPAWSPDGSKIAYVSLEDWCIWVMNADGSAQQKLTDHGGLSPAWSADGARIAYDGGRRNASGDPVDLGIWIINADGSGDHFAIEDGNDADWTN